MEQFNVGDVVEFVKFPYSSKYFSLERQYEIVYKGRDGDSVGLEKAGGVLLIFSEECDRLRVGHNGDGIPERFGLPLYKNGYWWLWMGEEKHIKLVGLEPCDLGEFM